jgi:hypothetical protein
MPDAEAAKVARRVQGWGRACGDAWGERLEREEAERARAVREAAEEERAREARETAAVGEGRSKKETGVESRDEVREGGNEEDRAVAEGTCRSDGHRTTETAAAGSTDLGTSPGKGADRDKEVGEVEIEEVEGI